MEKPLVLLMEDMSKDVEETINKYVNRIPANIIATTLTKVVEQLGQIYQQQITIAQKEYEESQKEDTENEKVD